jgi:hypothetical protein
LATRTFADLVLETLRKLGVVPDGATPGVEETASVTAALPSLLEEYAAREIVFVPDVDNIPDAWLMSLAAMSAYELRTGFGIVGEEAADLQAGNQAAILKLKVMLRGKPTGESLRTLYF